MSTKLTKVQENLTALQIVEFETQIDLIVLNNLIERNFHNSVIKIDVSRVGGYDSRTGRYKGN